MFNLEKSIREWKKTLFRSQNMEDADVAELESHVRDEIDRLRAEGLDDETAFRKAVDGPAAAEILEAEYAKVRRFRGDKPRWHPVRLLPSFAWSHLKIAFRKMRKQKAYSFINIVGLALGLTCSILIFFWVRDELGVNLFHEKADRIYRINKIYTLGDTAGTNTSTPFPLADAVDEMFAEIEDSTRYYRVTALVEFGDKVFYERSVCLTDTSFFNIFTFPFVKGGPAAALGEQGSIFITETTAAKYFGSEDSLGKTLILDREKSFIVRGVIEDPPPDSDLRFDLFAPVAAMLDPALLEDWTGHYAVTFVQLGEGVDPAATEAKLSALIKERLPDEKISLGLQPLAEIHLHAPDGSEQGMRYVRLFALIAVFILVIACINYINLSTARSEQRAREVGLRKVVGGRRGQIAWQFFAESVLFTLISLVAALFLVQSLHGIYRDLTGKTLLLSDFSPGVFAGLLLLALFTGLASGTYPALVLSAFKPAQALRDNLDRPGRKASFRKALVVLQVALSIMLIIAMGAIEKQLKFMRMRDPGFNKENVLFMRIPEGAAQNYETFRNELLTNPAIQGTARTLQLPGEMSAIFRGIRWEGMEAGESAALSFIPVDYDTLDLMEMTIAEGRNFSREFPSDESNYILNEKAVEVMGLEDPIGKPFSLDEDIPGTIIGVVKDFHSMPLNFGIEPAVLLMDPQYYAVALVKIRPGKQKEALGAIETAWDRFAPGFPCEYRHLDERFDLYYGAEILAGKILRYFVVIAVIISCLGLLGLSAFIAEQKTKEIGIRRTLGASVPQVVLLFVKQFLPWVLLANVLAWPAAYFGLRGWLNNYSYRTALGMPLFLMAAAAALVIAMITVSIQAVRAARADPIDSLRYE